MHRGQPDAECRGGALFKEQPDRGHHDREFGQELGGRKQRELHASQQRDGDGRGHRDVTRRRTPSASVNRSRRRSSPATHRGRPRHQREKTSRRTRRQAAPCAQVRCEAARFAGDEQGQQTPWPEIQLCVRCAPLGSRMLGARDDVTHIPRPTGSAEHQQHLHDEQKKRGAETEWPRCGTSIESRRIPSDRDGDAPRSRHDRPVSVTDSAVDAARGNLSVRDAADRTGGHEQQASSSSRAVDGTCRSKRAPAAAAGSTAR